MRTGSVGKAVHPPAVAVTLRRTRDGPTGVIMRQVTPIQDKCNAGGIRTS